MRLLTAIIIIIMLVSLTACKPAGTAGTQTAAQSPVSAEQASSDVEADITGLDTLSKDLDTSDMDNLDSELDQVDW